MKTNLKYLLIFRKNKFDVHTESIFYKNIAKNNYTCTAFN